MELHTVDCEILVVNFFCWYPTATNITHEMFRRFNLTIVNMSTSNKKSDELRYDVTHTLQI